MEKTELLKLMNKEQLVKVVNSMIDENKILKNQRRASESQSLTRLSRVKNLEHILENKNKEFHECAEISMDRLSTLESIATEVNRSTVFFKDVKVKDELLTFKNCSNIIDRLQDRFNMNEDGLLICNVTKKPF